MKNRGPLLVVKTKLQGQLLWVVFAAMAVPTLVLGGGLIVVLPFFPLLDLDVAPDEMRTRALLGISVLFPVLATAMFGWAFYLTNRLVGPVERMIRELDARVKGTAAGPITLRPKDLLLPLADKINELLAELDRHRQASKS